MTRIVEIARWEPQSHLPELPLGGFNLSWIAGEGRLVCTGLYDDATSKRPAEVIVIEFDEVQAFMALDEHADGLREMGVEPPPLHQRATLPGYWPFAEVLLSRWVMEMAERDGASNITHFRHWVVVTRNQTLHVAAHFEGQPLVHWVVQFGPRLMSIFHPKQTSRFGRAMSGDERPLRALSELAGAGRSRTCFRLRR